MLNRFQLFLKYLYNSRIHEYDTILKVANNNGYKIVSLLEYVQGCLDHKEKVLILRHDVDHVSFGTNLMFEVEKKYGAHASYYFRDSKFDESTVDRELMQEIEDYGSEASFHFETIANYGIMNNIPDRQSLLDNDYFLKCRQLLKQEIENFREKYGVSCKTIASHGTAYNSEVGVSNNALTEDTDCYELLGLKAEAYNKELIEGLGIYISDIPIEINDGYRYGVSVLEALEKEISPILFLSHPNHWHYSLIKQIKKLIKVIIYPPQRQSGKFVRIIK